MKVAFGMRLWRIIWRFDGSRAAICSSGGLVVVGRGDKGGVDGVRFKIRGRGGRVRVECVSWVCEIDDLSTLDSNVRYILEQS